MNYWLMKSEPESYSIDNLKRDKIEPWSGVRNYQVRNMMRDQMQKGDMALFYHSSAGKETGVVGVMKIDKNAYPDPTQFDPKSIYFDEKSSPENPRWLCVDVKFVKKFSRIITLIELKQQKFLGDLPILKQGSRLSVTPLTTEQFDLIVALAED